jgi:hypothetical protein
MLKGSTFWPGELADDWKHTTGPRWCQTELSELMFAASGRFILSGAFALSISA